MSYQLGKKSWKALQGVHPALAFAVTEAIKLSKQDFTVFEGLRSVERQKELVAKGSSKTMDSYHLYGLAVDLVAIVDGKVTWEEKYYYEIGAAMKEVIARHSLPIDWGYELWKWDLPHWQMTGYKDKYDIRKLTT
jgi:peptidoglycan L-alanyl-D-glutamate endopeptidase CwlK